MPRDCLDLATGGGVPATSPAPEAEEPEEPEEVKDLPAVGLDGAPAPHEGEEEEPRVEDTAVDVE